MLTHTLVHACVHASVLPAIDAPRYLTTPIKRRTYTHTAWIVVRDNNVDKAVERTARQPLPSVHRLNRTNIRAKRTREERLRVCARVSKRGEKKDTEGESEQEGVRTG